MKTILFTGAARRGLRSLPDNIRQRIESKLDDYADTGVGDVRSLAGQAGARLRVGDYRIIFTESADTITVIGIGHRRDVYR